MKAMTPARRIAAYRAQNGTQKLTPRQSRRLRKKTRAFIALTLGDAA